MYTYLVSLDKAVAIPGEIETVLPEQEETQQEVQEPVVDFSEDIYNQLLVTNSLLFRIYFLIFLLFGMKILNFFYRLIKHNVTDIM